jgi:hypothetical protein
MVLFALAGALQGQPCSAAGDRMLVFTRTAGYRHDSIPAAVAAIRDLAAPRHRGGAHGGRRRLPARRSCALQGGRLRQHDRQCPRPRAAAGLRGFRCGGRRLPRIHSAADTGYDWPWYGQLLGAQFKSHPPGLQTGVVRFARPLGAPAPIAWRVTDEFYDFASRPSGEAAVIARLDESTYEGGQMGAEHPIAWCRKVHGGRSWYTGLGHRPELFADPVFLGHLDKGVRYAMSRSEDC